MIKKAIILVTGILMIGCYLLIGKATSSESNRGSIVLSSAKGYIEATECYRWDIYKGMRGDIVFSLR